MLTSIFHGIDPLIQEDDKLAVVHVACSESTPWKWGNPFRIDVEVLPWEKFHGHSKQVVLQYERRYRQRFLNFKMII